MFSNHRSARTLDPTRRRRSTARAATLWLLVVPCLASACEPELIVGTWSKPPDATAGSAGTNGGGGTPSNAGSAGSAGTNGGGGTPGTAGSSSGDAGMGGEPAVDAGAGGVAGGGECDGTFVIGGEGGAPPAHPMNPIAVPWSTGFENGFCDYVPPRGYCYIDGTDASHDVVTTPVNSGLMAASFSATSAAGHTRCVRQGILPADAYYGAWFYVPARAESAVNWNLMYFAGGSEDGSLRGLWDVSIDVAEDGRHALYVRDQLRRRVLTPPSAPEIPIGAWFHVEFRLRRAADETGVVALYQDEALIFELADVMTDDSVWGQWYVGNLLAGVVPPETTVYVDDVSISSTP